jgi:hypothetical protein
MGNRSWGEKGPDWHLVARGCRTLSFRRDVTV